MPHIITFKCTLVLTNISYNCNCNFYIAVTIVCCNGQWRLTNIIRKYVLRKFRKAWKSHIWDKNIAASLAALYCKIQAKPPQKIKIITESSQQIASRPHLENPRLAPSSFLHCGYFCVEFIFFHVELFSPKFLLPPTSV